MGIVYIKLAQMLATQNYGNLFTEEDRKMLSSICDACNPIDYDEILDILKEEYDKKLDYDIKLCSTSLGPHKDDIEFFLGDKNLKFYGSQGQQRVAVLALKLSEIEIFKKYRESTPILLLDDIFSELDDIKKNNLLKYISRDIQTIITTTDLNNLDNKLIKKSKLFNINNGNIIKIKEVKLDE